MNQLFVANAWEDYHYWLKNDIQTFKKVNQLIKDIATGNPYEGIGKPEPLKHDLSGYWSRRLNREHRLIYKVEDGTLIIYACRYHY